MTTILVATTGGHLTQLLQLSSRLDIVDDEHVWVTHRTPQSESLLAGQRVEFVPYINERDIVGVLRSIGHARRLIRREQPTAMVSTGSAIALGYLGWGSARGVPCYYIESAARSGGPSRTGSILSGWPRVHVFTQYPGRIGGPWRYVGSVFDGFEPVVVAKPDRPLRVVVTVGSTDWPFDRLLRHLGAIAPPDAEFVWQIGASTHTDLPGLVHDFLPASELAEHLARADVVVAHAGCGSALSALNAGRAPILIPRLAAHNEIGDDHQDQLADLLQGKRLGLHRSVEDLAWVDLEEAAAMGATTAAEPSPLVVSH